MWLPKPQFFGSNIAKFSVERNFFSWPNTWTRPGALGQVPEPAREKFEIPVPARNPKIQKKGYPNPLDTRKIHTRHITNPRNFFYYSGSSIICYIKFEANSTPQFRRNFDSIDDQPYFLIFLDATIPIIEESL